MDRDTLVQVCICGVVGGSLSAGAVSLINLGFPPDAVIGFLGAMVGAFMAIGGAIWHDGFRDRTRRASELNYLQTNIDNLKTIYSNVLPNADEDTTPFDELTLNHISNTTEISRQAVDLAISHLTTLNLMDRLILNQAMKMLEGILQSVRLTREAQTAEGAEVNAANLHSLMKIALLQLEVTSQTLRQNGGYFTQVLAQSVSTQLEKIRPRYPIPVQDSGAAAPPR